MELTEKEKCQKGQLYDANNDPELVAERAACKEACFRYNQLPPSCMEERKLLPGVSIGDNCVIGAGSVVNKDIPANSLAAGNPCKVIRQLEPQQS